MTAACITKDPRVRKARAFVLGDFAPYRIVTLAHLISDRLSRAYRDENLTIPEWRVLAVIAQADAVAARDVVRQTPMDKMTVSRAVASLEAKQFVRRSPHSNDKRVAMMALSTEGRALFDRVAALAIKFEDDLLAVLPPPERAAFAGALAKLERGLEDGRELAAE